MANGWHGALVFLNEKNVALINPFFGTNNVITNIAYNLKLNFRKKCSAFPSKYDWNKFSNFKELQT